MENWIRDAKNLREDDVLIMLVGNKSDLESQRQVSQQEAQEYADSREIMYFEISARMGDNINTAFNEMAKKLTGIETNPIKESEIKSTNPAITGGFTLGKGHTDAAAAAGTEGKKGKKKSNC